VDAAEGGWLKALLLATALARACRLGLCGKLLPQGALQQLLLLLGRPLLLVLVLVLLLLLVLVLVLLLRPLLLVLLLGRPLLLLLLLLLVLLLVCCCHHVCHLSCHQNPHRHPKHHCRHCHQLHRWGQGHGVDCHPWQQEAAAAAAAAAAASVDHIAWHRSAFRVARPLPPWPPWPPCNSGGSSGLHRSWTCQGPNTLKPAEPASSSHGNNEEANGLAHDCLCWLSLMLAQLYGHGAGLILT